MTNNIVPIVLIVLLIILLYFSKNNNEKFTNNNIIKLNSWYGRLGNNIKQIINGLHLMIGLKCNIIIPPLNMFDFSYLPKYDNTVTQISNSNIDIDNNLFDQGDIIQKYKNLNIDNIFKYNKKEVIINLRKIFKIKYKNVKKYDNNDLHIHIRTGDIFRNEVVSWYMQPPLDFYVKIIESRKFNNIYLLAEDNFNPTIDKLIEKYPNIIWNKNNLNDDIKIIMGCKNIVFGIGSFIPNILYFNEGLKEIFVPTRHDYIDGYMENVKETVIDLSDYYNKLGQAVGLEGDKTEGVWMNTPEQLKVMVEYKLNYNII